MTKENKFDDISIDTIQDKAEPHLFTVHFTIVTPRPAARGPRLPDPPMIEAAKVSVDATGNGTIIGHKEMPRTVNNLTRADYEEEAMRRVKAMRNRLGT